MSHEQEILTSYREITITLERYDMELQELENGRGFIGGPRPVRSPLITGMPRGTNNPEAAIIQRDDVDEEIRKEIIMNIRKKQAEQREMMMEAIRIVESIENNRTQNIVAYYYLHGWTDDKISRLYDRSEDDDEDEGRKLSRQMVQKIRSDYFKSLA
jgi:hypothetical protein